MDKTIIKKSIKGFNNEPRAILFRNCCLALVRKLEVEIEIIPYAERKFLFWKYTVYFIFAKGSKEDLKLFEESI